MERNDHELAQKLRALRDWALTSEEYNQRVWAQLLGPTPDCGTVMCLASKVVTDAGYKLLFGGVMPGGAVQRFHPPNVAFTCSLTDESAAEHIEERAQKILGLTEGEARLLFHSGDEYWLISEELALDFLDHLIRRAEGGQGPMTQDEVDEWQEDWWACQED
jgi:hypothetical protein